MKIRRATTKDIKNILNVWNQAGLPIKPQGRDSIENLKKQIAQSNLWFLVAEENRNIVGVVLVTHDSRKGWINRLAVIPTMQRKGIAMELIKAAEKSLLENNIGVFAALIEIDNTASRRLFEKSNYEYHQNITYYVKKIFPDI